MARLPVDAPIRKVIKEYSNIGVLGFLFLRFREALMGGSTTPITLLIVVKP